MVRRIVSRSEHKRIAAQGGRILDDGFGNQWVKCKVPADCALEIVRPGKVQCEHDACPHRADSRKA